MYYSRRGGSSLVRSAVMGYVMSRGCSSGILMPGIDNYAHAGGFAGGYLAGMWLDPLKPERIDHMIGAAVCVALTALAILASIVVFLWPLIMQMFGAPRRSSAEVIGRDSGLGSRRFRRYRISTEQRS